MILAPATETEVSEIVRAARAAGRPLAIEGGGTRRGLGRPLQTGDTLSLARLIGITLHEPAEMVVSAMAGTPLAVVEETLASKGQMLPFEPMDHRALYGTEGAPTIGAVAAGNISGPRRISAGAARDSLIGVRFVNGLGEAVKSGGRVMKNVTGLDLVKLQAGALGTLGVLTEVTFKVLPQPESALTLVATGLDDARAIGALSLALGSPFEPTGAAHVATGGSAARTLLRLEGFRQSIDYRAHELRRLLAGFGHWTLQDGEASARAWREVRDVLPLAARREDSIWRISVAPSRMPALLASAAPGLPRLLDWGGGLGWLAVPAAETEAVAARLRAALDGTNGHATLVRAPDAVRAALPVFQPLPAAIMRLQEGIRRSFDPDGILNPGLLHAGV
jgi:glycolate oxidase FAD binding subunit